MESSEGHLGQKRAVRGISAGETVIKYGYPIGRARTDIAAGEWVGPDQLGTALAGIEDFVFRGAAPVETGSASPLAGRSFRGFVREDGRVGIRNEVWIIPTVGCVNDISREIMRQSQAFVGGSVSAVRGFCHPYGCSQLGEDKERTIEGLCGLIRHPNASGVLVLGLGCENSGIGEFRRVLGDYDPERVRFLVCQDCGDEIAEGVKIVRELCGRAVLCRRESVPVSRLCIGLKCGGSDGLSGVTANPLLGRLTDALCAAGGQALLTEVPEMFGAETLLLERAGSREVFERARTLMQDFRRYYLDHGEPISENPSPGNIAGGITTLEEKSLGCVQKGGHATVTGVYDYGQTADRSGLGLVWGPGNDLVSTAALAFSGAQLILFTTGRGTPLGSPVPTLKLSTNSALAARKPGWIDFDAGRVLSEPAERLDEELAELVLAVASGREVRAERLGGEELALFKSGVIL